MKASQKKETMSVREMREILGIKKTDSYWLIKRQYFKTVIVDGKIRVDIKSFEDWYASQEKYHKFVDLGPEERERFLQQHIDDVVGRKIRNRYIRQPDKTRLDEKSWFSPEEVADIMAIDRKAVLRLIRNGSLTVQRFGKQFRISKDEVLWLISREKSKRTGGI